MNTSRDFDIILFGASGFTGRLVAEYFLENAPATLSWALAGRNTRKLEGVREKLAGAYPKAKTLEILTGDSLDRNAMDAIAGRARVICTTVGPYAKYGEPLVAACAKAGTHYCDLTGEPQFIRRMVDDYEATAKTSGARIVHCCGFDSIPSDLGTFMLGEAMASRNATLKEVHTLMGETKGAFSGGTVASLLNALDEAKRDPSLRKILGHPYGLNPEGHKKGPDSSDQVGVRFEKQLGMWTGPFVMATINTRIVRRSHALRGFPYGKDFRYAEAMSMGKGFVGCARALALTGGLGGFLAASQVKPFRKWLDTKLPKPGEGPSKEARERGFFVMRQLARGETHNGQTIRLRSRIEGKKDPGYGETAKMLGESALCLALDAQKLPVQGGNWTPASAMGQVLLDRLRQAGMVFEVKEG